MNEPKTIFYMGVEIPREVLNKLYEDAKYEVSKNIALELEGLQSVADHCKDDKTTYRLEKYLTRIKERLS